MRDRIPTKVLDNGAVRYAVYDEGGKFLRYEYMLPADEPTEEGTALNKASLLDDSTEMALWGNLANRTVNNALMEIGAGLRLHCWKRRSVSRSLIFGDLTWYSLTKATSSSATTTITYSDNYVVNADNSVGLASPTSTVSISYKNSGGDTYTGVPTLKGKYFKGEAYKANVTSSSIKNPVNTVPGAIYYAPPDAGTNPTGTSSKYTVDIQAQLVENKTTYGEWEYVYSDNRNTYIDSGEADNYEYLYLGIPIYNAIESVKVEQGTYVGTGTTGKDNPTSLTFSFPPKIIFFIGNMRTANNSQGIAPFFMMPERGSYNGDAIGLTRTQGNIEITGTTVSWYETYNSAESDMKPYNQYGQLNAAGYTYRYVAIG